MTDTLTLRRPDDWHLHLRDGAMLEGVLPETARHFARAIVMPNLVPPVVTAAEARAYRGRIMAALPQGMAFEPLMTLYLTETTDPADVAAAHADGLITAVKLYPAGATTNSQSGVRDLDRVMPVLENHGRMIALPLCIQRRPRKGLTDPAVATIFDREQVFLDNRCSNPALRRLPRLKGTLETCHHLAASSMLRRAQGHNRGPTITTHHLMINRNQHPGRRHPAALLLLACGQARPPTQQALAPAATSGKPAVLPRTDSAPPQRPPPRIGLRPAPALLDERNTRHASPIGVRERARSTGSSLRPRSSAPAASRLAPMTPRSRRKGARQSAVAGARPDPGRRHRTRRLPR